MLYIKQHELGQLFKCSCLDSPLFISIAETVLFNFIKKKTPKRYFFNSSHPSLVKASIHQIYLKRISDIKN